MANQEERNRILGNCEIRTGLASSVAGMSIYGGTELLTNCVGAPLWPIAALGVGAGSYICGSINAAGVNDCLYPEDTGEAVAVELPATMRRDISNDRRLLRYVRGLHTGSIQSQHGGRLVHIQTTPRNFPRHVLESIQRRVHPEAINFDNELIRQAASGEGKEDR